MKKHIPNTLTCLNLLTGALGCVEILQGDFHMAIYYVIIAGIFDFLDGFVARLLKVQSAIGKELDSLADMVSFGLLPALYMMMFIKVSDSSSDYTMYAGLLIAAFAAIRLAKFNIDTRQSDQFIGVPTPANTILITSFSFLPDGWNPNEWILVGIAIISCYIMVMEVPMIALKFKGASFAKNKWKYFLLAIIAVLLIVFKISALPFIIPAYIVLSIAENLMDRKVA